MATAPTPTLVNALDGTTPVWTVGTPESDAAVVFLHGVPGPGSEWKPLLSEIGMFTRAIAPDLPGFGSATTPEGFTYTSDEYAAFIANLLDDLGIATAHLVLHDFGGPWGLTWAARHPERFASATLINTGAWIDYRWHFAARLYRAPVVGEISMATATYRSFASLMRYRSRRPLPEASIRAMWDTMTPTTRKTVLRLYRAMPDPAGDAGVLAAALRPLDRPALVIWGATDWGLPVALAERQREAFPSADIHVLSDSGHYPQFDDPDRVSSLVVPFLRARAAAPRD